MIDNFKTVMVTEPRKNLMGIVTEETKNFIHMKDVLVLEGGMKYMLPEVSIHRSSIGTIIDFPVEEWPCTKREEQQHKEDEAKKTKATKSSQNQYSNLDWED